jgi:hypothetical protein
MFLAIVKYSHGGKMTHEFRCPLERKRFVDNIRKQDPAARIKLRQRRETDEVVPQDEAQWYGGGA